MKIHLHIDRIVVGGLPFAAADAARFRGALERELAALFAQPAPRANWRAMNVAHADAAPVRLTRNPGADSMGREVARSIGGAIPK
ncbi:MAG TPA: hypothetical protein VKB79_27110 [Bryobacteraceae bacterium]|nr:hypothetical protein [Bryobacteraceae bacterium]